MPSTDKKPATQVNPDSFTIMDHFRDAHIRNAMASSLPIAMPPMVFSQFHQNNVNGYVTAPAKGKTVMVRSTDNLANTVPGELKE